VLLRGIWYRAGRSALVLLLTAIAVAAAVLAPGFSRAAQQSVLTGGLSAAPAAATGLTVSATGAAVDAPAAHRPLPETRSVVATTLAGYPGLASVLAEPIAGVDTDTTVSGGSEPVAARLAYRDRVCEHLAITGACPTGPAEVLISDRTAADHQLAAGDPLVVAQPGRSQELAVVGVYQPGDPADPYWGGTVYFTHGGFDPVTGAPRVDAMFTGDPAAVVADPTAEVTAALTYPLRPAAVRLDEVAGLRADLTGVHNAVRTAGLELATELPAVLDDVAADRAAIGRTAPVLAIPLLLLAWIVLFLLVAAVTEERGQEIALARLRGFGSGRAARFGLGEVLVLIAAAAPVGLALGLAAVELAARAALAPGSHVELRWPVLSGAAAALAAAALAAALAARGTLRRGPLELLRRVPQRVRWRAGAVEAAVVALAAAALVVALGDPAAPLALLAPGLVAVVAGIAAARLATLLAGLRLRRARGGSRARLPGQLAAAQLARRPSGRRVIAVATVAVALLSFAAIAWDVAAQARHDHAAQALGADRVYTVAAEHPAALVGAVQAADPDGFAMAVVRASQQYAGEQVELLAVDAPRLPQVMTWRGRDAAGLGRLAAALRPVEPQPLPVGDRIEVTARVSDLGEQPVRLTALVSPPGQPPQSVPLGTLAEETDQYGARVPQCAAGCRLLGFGLGRPGVAGPFTATVVLRGIRSGGELLAARFDEPAAWHAPAGVQLSPGAALTVSVGDPVGDPVDDGSTDDVLLEYRDGPPAVPAVLAGGTPADDPAAQQFRFPGLSQRPEPFEVADRVDRLPRAGRGLLLDLRYAVASAERSAALADQGGLRYEVWAGADAPADLPQRLAQQGVAVLETETIDGTVARLAGRAPALGIWLGLLAAAVALGLAVGVIALSSRVQLAARRYDLAALRVAGVPAALLRRALWREYAALLGWPLLFGTVVGVATAALLLPGMPLVEAGLTGELAGIRPAWRAVPAAAIATGIGLLLAALAAVRLPAADRLAEGVR
jgi:hypothetical protein